MVSIPVVNVSGEQRGQVELDEALLGGEVRPVLLKQAIVAYLDHQRHHSARTKGRGHVEGSTRKLYKQKGTGRARMGNVRTPVRRGGGVTFAKRGPRRSKALPRSMRALAWKNAILAKIRSEQMLILEGLSLEQPKTRTLAAVLGRVGAGQGCVLATPEVDRMVWLSGRNIPKTEIRPLSQLCAYEILRRQKLVLTADAFEALKKRLAGEAA